MAQLNTTPVVKCRRCGKLLTLSATTTQDDADGEMLQRITAWVARNPLCEFHQKQRAWYAQQNRLQEWESGNL